MIRALLVTLLGATFITCLIMPLVFDLLTLVYPNFPWPFSRIFDRVFLLLLAIFIWRFRGDFNLKAIPSALSWPKPWAERGGLILWGTAITGISIGICAIGIFSGESLSLNPRDFGELLRKILVILPSAFLIALIEELFFRVLLLGRLKDYFPVSLAITLSALIYAVVHFITPEKQFAYRGQFWWDGFLYLPALINRLLLPGTELGVFALWIVGVILAHARLRYNSVYLVIGMHAGWIFSLKLISFVSWPNPLQVYSVGLTGRYALFQESLAWVSLLLVFLLLYTLERVGYLKRVSDE